ncbi:hypothetical protein OMK64_01735 [Cellulomonas fimi]|uniref:hypothetical protein n=1 Tax=Cellulomonas fimi TaxID=1708 RepID=UPI00234D4840|nr:hypothetical protein [Cellulomonas fimi]MDC7120253.1 hypothetical protein [Cellulomonas fimi]
MTLTLINEAVVARYGPEHGLWLDISDDGVETMPVTPDSLATPCGKYRQVVRVGFRGHYSRDSVHRPYVAVERVRRPQTALPGPTGFGNVWCKPLTLEQAQKLLPLITPYVLPLKRTAAAIVAHGLVPEAVDKHRAAWAAVHRLIAYAERGEL